MPFRRLQYRIAASVAAGTLCLLLAGYEVAPELQALDDQAQIARLERFVAGEAFAVGGRIGDHPVATVGLNFERFFYPLVEIDVVAIRLEVWTLGRAADDATLIAMIGGESKIAASLAAIHALIALGHRGDSHMDGQSNFAYARSPVDGRLWAIHWTMSADNGWIVGAVIVPHPHMDWPAGSRLFAPAIANHNANHRM